METRRIACLQSFIYKCGPCRFRDEGDGRGGDESTARSTARTQTQPRSGEATCAVRGRVVARRGPGRTPRPRPPAQRAQLGRQLDRPAAGKTASASACTRTCPASLVSSWFPRHGWAASIGACHGGSIGRNRMKLNRPRRWVLVKRTRIPSGPTDDRSRAQGVGSGLSSRSNSDRLGECLPGRKQPE